MLRSAHPQFERCFTSAVLLLALTGVSTADPQYTDYIVGYIHTFTITGDSSGGVDGDGEVMIGITTSDGTRERELYYPQKYWEVSEVTDKVLTRYPDPFANKKKKLNLRETGRPWGMPFFAEKVDTLPNALGIALSVVEDDSPCGDGFEWAVTYLDKLADIAVAAARLAAGASTAESRDDAIDRIVANAAAITQSSLFDFWQPDTVMVHANNLSKEELLDLAADATSINVATGAGGTKQVDGSASISYVFRRVRVLCGTKIRLTLDRLQHGGNGDPYIPFAPSSERGELAVYTRVMNGLWVGEVPIQGLRDFSRNIDEAKWWTIDNVLLPTSTVKNKVGPFVSFDCGVWDVDDCSVENDRDLMGHVFGLWITNDLVEGLYAEPKRQVTYVVQRNEDGTLRPLEFTLELESAGIDDRGLTISPPTALLNQSFKVCRKIYNACDAAPYVDLDVSLGFNGKEVGTKTVRINKNSEAQVCFDHKLTKSTDNNKVHRVNVTAKGVNRWKDMAYYVGPGPQ